MLPEKFPSQFPSLFDRLLQNDFFDWPGRHFSKTHTTLPSVNIKESKNAFEVEVAAPGFNKNEINIELKDNVLTISSEKKTEKEEKEGDEFTKREFSYQSFCRSFTLPNTSDSENISAKYEKGILLITIPKKEEPKEQAGKKINIL